MKTIKNHSALIRGLFAGAAIAASAASHAALIDEPVPDSLIVERSGLEWVWASPVAPDGSFGSGSTIELNWDFRLPTEEEWLASFSGLTDLYDAFNIGASQLCASGYFTSSTEFNHCDGDDIQKGNVWGSPWPQDPAKETFDTFLVRGELNQTPLPATLALLGAGLFALGLSRRKRPA